ncbi:MAG: suppressor of fused domain protein [Polyangiaceae bacterium]
MTVRPLDFSKLPDVSELHPELNPEEQLYAAHMLARENALEAIFGETDPPDQILSPDDPDFAAGWPGGGVYQYPARGKRSGVHYVTHGLAQPMDFDDPVEPADEPRSGLGIELVLSTPNESEWPVVVLFELVKYLLFAENARLFLPGHRIPASLLQQVDPSTQLTHLFGIASAEYESELLLPAGACTLVHLVGATMAEIERAKQHRGTTGTYILSETLRELGVGHVTDLKRACATKDARFDAVWAAVAKKYEEAGRERPD